MRQRFEARETEQSGPNRFAVYDHNRGTLEPTRHPTRADADNDVQRLNVERADTWGTVVFTEAIPTPKRPGRRRTLTCTGDITARDEQGVTIIDLRRIQKVIPSTDVTEVVFGTVVAGMRPILRGRRAGGVQPNPGDVAGWTAQRHTELRKAVVGRVIPASFGEFMQRYNLGRADLQSEEMLRRSGGARVVMNAGPMARWLLEQWDHEHPEPSSP